MVCGVRLHHLHWPQFFLGAALMANIALLGIGAVIFGVLGLGSSAMALDAWAETEIEINYYAPIIAGEKVQKALRKEIEGINTRLDKQSDILEKALNSGELKEQLDGTAYMGAYDATEEALQDGLPSHAERYEQYQKVAKETDMLLAA